MSQFEIHKQNEIRKQEIEVKALVALMTHGKESFLTSDGHWIKPKKMAEEALYNIAFPNMLASDINQEKITNSKKRIQRDYFGNCMTCGGSTDDSGIRSTASLEKCECKQ